MNKIENRYFIFFYKIVILIWHSCFSFKRIVMISILSVIIYNEYICYVLNTLMWPKIFCKDEKNCVKILLVADPQLIDDYDRAFRFLKPFKTYDCDR